MRNFNLQVGLFCSLQFFVGALIISSSILQPRYGFLASFEDKVQLLEKHDQPHLIVIGGSNVVFGINSPMLEKQVGMPVINAGLHGALGLQFYLDVAETYSKPGDVIVLIPEWILLSSRIAPDEDCMFDLIEQSPSALRFSFSSSEIDWKQYIDEQALAILAQHVQAGLEFQAINQQEIKKLQTPGKYSRPNFNRYGDFIGHHHHKVTKKISQLDAHYSFDESRYQISVERINECANALNRKGVTLLFAYSPVPETVYLRSKNDLRIAHEFLTENINIPILHPPVKTKYPISYFYDTINHLNLEGKAVRTELIIHSLQKHFTIAKSAKQKQLR